MSADIQPPSMLPDSCICSIDTSVHDTFTALCASNCGKAMGGDCIPSVILKGASTSLLEPLHHLFTLCIEQSTFPAE